MEKRTVFSFFIMCMISAALIMRIGYVSSTLTADTGTDNSYRVIDVASSRGMIYDRNMIPLVNVSSHSMLFVNPTRDALSFVTQQKGVTLSLTGTGRKPILVRCDYTENSHPDVTEIIVYDRYSSEDVAVHLTGYTDNEGNGVSGIEKSFDSILNAFSGNVSVRYQAAANGMMLAGHGAEIVSNSYASRGGIVLTIDRNVQKICEDAMNRNSLNKGAVVVLDVLTGEILALASNPVFDRTDLGKSLDDKSQPFVNRALSAYAVGSVFKTVVAAAALESGISESLCFECTGNVNVSGVVFNCHERNGHGLIDMTQAMAVSCNCYFIKLGQLLGAEKIVKTASLMGLGKEIVLCNGMASSQGNLPSAEDIDSLPFLANLSFGQGTLLATPLQIAALYQVFATDGYYTVPYVTKNMVDEDGKVYAEYRNDSSVKVLSEDVCEKITRMLEKTVTDGSGKNAAPMTGVAAGKTATAETGKTENGEKMVHTWFAGYYPSESPRYVIVVFREDGNNSGADTAPVFRDIVDSLSGK